MKKPKRVIDKIRQIQNLLDVSFSKPSINYITLKREKQLQRKLVELVESKGSESDWSFTKHYNAALKTALEAV